MLCKISKSSQQINDRVEILTQDSKFITMIIKSYIYFFNEESRLLYQRSLFSAYISHLSLIQISSAIISRYHPCCYSYNLCKFAHYYYYYFFYETKIVHSWSSQLLFSCLQHSTRTKLMTNWMKQLIHGTFISRPEALIVS